MARARSLIVLRKLPAPALPAVPSSGAPGPASVRAV
jgi:hypothetical protein